VNLPRAPIPASGQAGGAAAAASSVGEVVAWAVVLLAQIDPSWICWCLAAAGRRCCGALGCGCAVAGRRLAGCSGGSRRRILGEILVPGFGPDWRRRHLWVPLTFLEASFRTPLVTTEFCLRRETSDPWDRTMEALLRLSPC
jgi:hypothetical protein